MENLLISIPFVLVCAIVLTIFFEENCSNQDFICGETGFFAVKYIGKQVFLRKKKMKVQVITIDTKEVIATFPSWEDYTNAMPNGLDSDNSKKFEIVVSK